MCLIATMMLGRVRVRKLVLLSSRGLRLRILGIVFRFVSGLGMTGYLAMLSS